MERPHAAAILWSALTYLALSSGVQAQLILGGAEPDRGIKVITTEDGGFLIVGVTRSAGAGGEDAHLVRLDADENVLFQKTHGGSGDDNGWSVVGGNRGFIVGGFTNSEGAGGNDCTLLSMDQEGELIWSRTFGGAGDDRCWEVAALADGGYALTGETDSFGAGERDCYLIRTDSDGNELWSKTYGGEADDRCFSLVSTADGGFVIAGQTYSYGSGDRDAWILKTDRAGSLDWSKTHGGAASDVAHSVIADGSDSFLVTGYTTSLAATPDDPLVLKFAADGALQWSQVLEMPGHNRTLTGALAVDEGFCLVGLTIGGDPSARAALVVKIDDAGQRLWSTRVLPSIIGESFGYGVVGTPDGGCAITGHTTEDSAGGIDLFFARVDGEGQLRADHD